MSVLTVVNSKGGSGKTTVSALTVLIASRLGYRVLAVDLDPQASLTRILTGGYPNPPERTVFAFLGLQPTVKFDEVIVRHSLGFDLLPSNQALYKEMYRFTLQAFSYQSIHSTLRPYLEEYDLVVVDSPPDPVFTKIALVISDYALVPVEPTPVSVEVTKIFLDAVVTGVKNDWFHPGRPRILGIIANKVDFRGGRPSERDAQYIRRVVWVLGKLPRDAVAGYGWQPVAWVPRSEEVIGRLEFERETRVEKLYRWLCEEKRDYGTCRDIERMVRWVAQAEPGG